MLVNCEILKKTKAKMKCSNLKKNKLPQVFIYPHYAFGNILFVFGNILIKRKKEYYQKQMHFYVVKL
jgi:hypothetical protein